MSAAATKGRREARSAALPVGSTIRRTIACTLLLALAGCGSLFGSKPAPVPVPGPGAAKPPVAAPPRERIPRDNQCGPVLDLRKWDVQCASENLAMMCRRSDRTDRRCARKRKGEYRWTYGSFCAHALPCYRRACN